jgi:hypothetical protein
MGPCEHGNEHSGSIECVEFLDKPIAISFSRRVFTAWCYLVGEMKMEAASLLMFGHCCLHLQGEDEGSKAHQKVGVLPHQYTTSQPRRLRLEYSLPWKHEHISAS